ncbi:MAG: histidine phosphatase family protein [Christensenellales bacterium]
MKLLLVRHGEPSYDAVTERGYIGHGRDLAALTAAGVAQAERASRDPRLAGAQLILASPYTRALQTAAVIQRNLQLPLWVETDLHEWMPDCTYQYGRAQDSFDALGELQAHGGVWDASCRYRWEEPRQVAQRAYACLAPYAQRYEKIIAVTHGMVICQFPGAPRDVPYCGILEVDFDASLQWPGYPPAP